MILLAHRGLWQERREANSISALSGAIRTGYGIEFDLRDAGGAIVVAHDVVDGPTPLAEELFAAYRDADTNAMLAVNIKADGIASRVGSLLAEYGVAQYFCFDMSVPETLHYRRLGLRYFTRQSEYEPSPVLYADATGVWMDMFESDWIVALDIHANLRRGKQVALVSPELHGRPHLAFWERLRAAGLARQPGLMLCTDHPDAARSFFDA